MLGADSACFWHGPLLLLATCFNKSANDNQKPHFSFLIKPFKNIKNTHDLNFFFKKPHWSDISETNIYIQSLDHRKLEQDASLDNILLAHWHGMNLGPIGGKWLAYGHAQFPRSCQFVGFIRVLIKARSSILVQYKENGLRRAVVSNKITKYHEGYLLLFCWYSFIRVTEKTNKGI